MMNLRTQKRLVLFLEAKKKDIYIFLFNVDELLNSVLQFEQYIDELAKINGRSIFFVVITCPPSRLSYWMHESPITTKPYFVKAQDVIWHKTSQSFSTMQAPCGASNLSDREYQVVWYMDKEQIANE